MWHPGGLVARLVPRHKTTPPLGDTVDNGKASIAQGVLWSPKSYTVQASPMVSARLLNSWQVSRSPDHPRVDFSPNAYLLTWPLYKPPGGLVARQVNLQAGWSPAWIPRELLYYLLLLLLLQPASGLKEA